MNIMKQDIIYIKNKIMQEIMNAYTYTYTSAYTYTSEWFIFQSHSNSFQMSFCSTCGNYTNKYYMYSDKLLCKCRNENCHHDSDNYLNHMDDVLENEHYREDFDMDEFYYHHNMDGDEQDEIHRMNMNDEPMDDEDMGMDDVGDYFDYYDYDK